MNSESVPNTKMEDALKISALDIANPHTGVGIVAYADFPYVMGHGVDGKPAVDWTRAEVWFAFESGLLRPRLRCPNCGDQLSHLYMTNMSRPPRCAKCSGFAE